jgi:hypothetical protein
MAVNLEPIKLVSSFTLPHSVAKVKDNFLDSCNIWRLRSRYSLRLIENVVASYFEGRIMSTRGYPRPQRPIRRGNPAAAASMLMAVVAIVIILVISLR